MNKVIEVLKNIWKITELKDRIGLTLILLVVYRFGAQVVLPGIDATKLGQIAENTEQGILGLLNAFTGGAFANASVFALGIMPYISASIVVQLMGIAIPYLQKLQKEGASGQKKITQITRWLTIAICLVHPKTSERDGVPHLAVRFLLHQSVLHSLTHSLAKSRNRSCHKK